MAPPSVSKIFRPVSRLQPTDVQAAALWGVTAGTFAIYLVQMKGVRDVAQMVAGVSCSKFEQPFDWIRQTFFEKAEPEQK